MVEPSILATIAESEFGGVACFWTGTKVNRGAGYGLASINFFCSDVYIED